jgi:CRP-like cAMP-binding protein
LDDKERKYVTEQLEDIPFFRAFSAEEIGLILPYFELQTYTENTILFDEGSRGDYLCFVLEGTLDLRKESVSSKQTVTAKFGRGSIMGEMALIDQYPRSATARVTANSKLLVLRRESFDQLVEQLPRIGFRFLKEIARIFTLRLRRSSGRFSDIF